MKETVLKALITAAIAGLAAYFQVLALPIMVLVVVMLVDYVTGMVQAFASSTLSSRVGILGILKKVCYLLMVGVGGVVDYLLQSALSQVGVTISLAWSVGLLVAIWLIINELISILENLSEIGVPMPGFLGKIVTKLKVAVDAKAEVEEKQ